MDKYTDIHRDLMNAETEDEKYDALLGSSVSIQRYVCPTKMTTADNKTTMCDGIVLYGTESKDGTETR